MANPGDFKVGDELFRTAFGSVCTAVLADDSAQALQSQNLVIKIYDPAGFEAVTGDAFDSSASLGSAEFLKRVDAQRQAAAAGKNWAPIHASGKNADGKSFYVTNYYPRSVQRLISGRVPLAADALHEIVNSIVGGLLEMNHACGRAHGNIKPSNVLIGGRGAVADAKIALTDPSPGPCTSTDDQAEDVRALGALIYHLVTHRVFHPTSWPIADSEPWRRLGNRNRPWRDFCTSLLNPDAHARPSLPNVAREVRSLVVIKIVNRTTKRIAAGALAIALLVGIAGWGVHHWEDGVREELTKSHEWLKALDARALDTSNADLFAADPYSACLQRDKDNNELIDAAIKSDGPSALMPAAMQRLRDARSAAQACHQAWIDAFNADALKEALPGQIKDALAKGWLAPGDAAEPVLPANPSSDDIVISALQLQQLRTRLIEAELTDIRKKLLQPLDELADTPLFGSGTPYAPCLARDKANKNLLDSALDQSRNAIKMAVTNRAWVALQPSVYNHLCDARNAARDSRDAWIKAFDQDRLKGNVSGQIRDAQQNKWIVPEKYSALPVLPENPTGGDIINRAQRLQLLRSIFITNAPTDRWNVFLNRLKPLQAVGVPSFYGGFARFLQEEAANSVKLSEKDNAWVVDPPNRIDDCAAMAAGLTETVKRDLDIDRMKRDQPSWNVDVPSAGTIAAFVAARDPGTGTWTSSADVYTRVVPHPGIAQANAFKKILKLKIDDRPNEWPVAGEGSYQSFINELKSLKTEIDDLAKVSYVRKDEGAASSPFLTAVRSISDRIDTVTTKFHQDPNARPTVDLKDFVVKNIDPIKLTNDQLLKIRIQQATELTARKFTQADADIQKARIVALCDALKKLDLTLTAFPAVPADLTEPYKAKSLEHRSEVLAALAKPLSNLSLSAQDLTALDGQVGNAGTDFTAWCRWARALAIAFPEIRKGQIIELTTFPVGEWENAGDGRKEFWQAEVRGENGKFLPALKPLLLRIDGLRQAQADPVATIAKTTAKDLETAGGAEAFIAAWQKLAPVPGPLSLKGLVEEGEIRKKLSAVYLAITGTRLLEAAPDLTKQLKIALDQGPGRWCDAYRGAQTSVENITTAMNARNSFAINDDALKAHSADLGPEGLFNAMLWLTENAPPSAAHLPDLKVASAALSEPFKVLARWLADSPAPAQLSAVLDQSLFCLANKPPDLIARALAASEKLRLAEPRQALSLSSWFHDHEAAAIAANRAAWAKNFLDLANAFPLAADKDSKISALTHAEDLGNTDAMVALAEFYTNGDPDGKVAVSIPKARQLYEKAAHANPPDQRAIARLTQPPFQVKPVLPTKPATPTGVVATTGAAGGIDLKWTAAKDATSYNVYRSQAEAGQYSRLTATPITATSYLDLTAPIGISYYRITAINGSIEGEQSTVVSGRVPEPPSLVATATGHPGGGIDLTWKGANDPAAVFNVYRAATQDGPFTTPLKKAIAGTSVLDESAPAGSVSFYRIVLVIRNVEGSAAITNAAPFPPLPAEPKATAAPTGGIKLTWKPVVDSSLKGYNVFRSAAPLGPFEPCLSVPEMRTSVLDPGAPPGITSYYKITAVDALSAFGEGSSTEMGGAETPHATAPPLPPAVAELKVKSVHGVIILKWPAVPDPTLISSYCVYRGTLSEKPKLLKTLPTASISYEDKEAVEGTTYSYEIRALNLIGEGSAATATAIVPPKPKDAAATVFADGIKVTWTTKGNDPNLTYTVSRIAPTGNLLTPVSIADGTVTDSLGATVGTTYLVAGTTYAYEIRAVTKIGDGIAAKATAIAPDRPAAPTNVKAAVATNSITVTWDPVPDPALILKEYSVFRDPPWPTFKKIVAAPGSSFIDAEVTPGTAYVYDIHGVNASGQGPPGWSPKVTVPTSTKPHPVRDVGQ